MRKPGTDPDNVQMSDVLCDFCRREWTAEQPMIEGHHGSCICGRCLSVAYAELVLAGRGTAPDSYRCTMCLEGPEDRAALDRAGEPGWQSPVDPEAAACLRCVKLAGRTLDRDRDFDWTLPAPP